MRQIEHKITDEQFELLKKEFSTDKDLKIKSERFSQERQSRTATRRPCLLTAIGNAGQAEIKTVVRKTHGRPVQAGRQIDLDKLNRRPTPAQEEKKRKKR